VGAEYGVKWKAEKGGKGQCYPLVGFVFHLHAYVIHGKY